MMLPSYVTDWELEHIQVKARPCVCTYISATSPELSCLSTHSNYWRAIESPNETRNQPIMTRKRAASAFQNPYISVSHQQQNQCSPKPAAQSQQIEVEAIEGLLDLCNGLKRAINTSGHAWKSYVRECHKLAASSPSPDAQVSASYC